MEGNRKINYNPADYKELQNEAKGKSKEELENFYVSTKDKKYTHPCVAILIGIVLMVFVVGCIWLMIESGKNEINGEVNKIIKEVSKDICPILGEDYVSIEFFESSNFFTSEYKFNKIDCRGLG